MSILKNAVDSLILGLEDYQSSDNRRLISCARNLFAGILLLFKHKLFLLSPENSNEVLIKQKIFPVLDSSGILFWKGRGRKTIDTIQIKERFESLRIDVDWEKVDKINKYRNDIEHYYSEISKKSLESLISDTFIIIRDFISIHLEEDPKKMLGDFAWDMLLNVSEVYEKEKQECVKKLEKYEWESSSVFDAVISFKCLECGSSLISVIDSSVALEYCEFCCKNCDEKYSYELLIKESLREFYSFNLYLSHTDGNELELIKCPYCFEDTYLYEEQKCILCGERAIHICKRCGSKIPPEEISDESYCAYCSYMMSKND